MNFAPNITINAGGMDSRAMVDMIKMQLNQQWASELGRLSRR